MLSSLFRPPIIGVNIVLSALLFGASVQSVRAQAVPQTPVDVQAIIKETQQTSQKDKTLTVAWWIPEQFWRASASQNAGSSPDRTEAMLKALRPYTLVAVLDAKMGFFGKLDYTPDADLAAEVSIKDGSGTIYTPLSDDQIEGDTKTFLGIMKPVLANMLGALGQNMHFFVFPARSKDGNAIADATKEALLFVEVGKKEFRWRLPLGSILPRKTCPACKESLSGAYKYCPYDGTKLPEPALPAGPSATAN